MTLLFHVELTEVIWRYAGGQEAGLEGPRELQFLTGALLEMALEGRAQEGHSPGVAFPGQWFSQTLTWLLRAPRGSSTRAEDLSGV